MPDITVITRIPFESLVAICTKCPAWRVKAFTGDSLDVSQGSFLIWEHVRDTGHRVDSIYKMEMAWEKNSGGSGPVTSPSPSGIISG